MMETPKSGWMFQFAVEFDALPVDSKRRAPPFNCPGPDRRKYNATRGPITMRGARCRSQRCADQITTDGRPRRPRRRPTLLADQTNKEGNVIGFSGTSPARSLVRYQAP